MYVTSVPNRTSRPTILIRESYRVDGKVKNKTIANITSWDKLRIEAVRRALAGEFDGVSDGAGEIGESFGTLFILKKICDDLGLTKALGRSKNGLLSLFLVLARICHQGSRLSATRWAKDHVVGDIIGFEEFDEDDLYKALDWLELNQKKLEKKLFDTYQTKEGKPVSMVLYDVTSSYFEGSCNELAEFGYNRDKKRGKRQIAIGLLTDENGEPLAVRVFKGNMSDPSTICDQIECIRNNFQVENVIFVGDKGMIKSTGKADIKAENWQYITTLTNTISRI